MHRRIVDIFCKIFDHVRSIPCFIVYRLKRKCRYLDEWFISGCTRSCYFDNFWCRKRLKCHQNCTVSACACHWEHEINVISCRTPISGSCGHDGVYIQDADSLVLCSNGIAYYQPCSPGTKNSGYNSHYDDHYTSGSYYNLNVSVPNITMHCIHCQQQVSRMGQVITSRNICGMQLQ